jgi:protein O-mannosyl-transferase
VTSNIPATRRASKLSWKNWKRKRAFPIHEDEMSRTKTFSKARAQARRRPNSKAPSRTGPFFTGKKLYAALCVLLALATMALYSPVIGHSFVVLDDREYVTANPHIQGDLGWSTIHWAFTSTYAANWHPLTWLSHALDYQLFALNPAGHHLDSVLIHTLNAVLLFLLLGWATKRVGPSLLVAALFAVHPINVESVAWVAERKNVLSTFLFFWAIGAYGWYARKPVWRRYLLVAALFAAGLMAKPMVITLPFVLLLLDNWPLDRTAGSPPSVVRAPQLALSKLILEKVPLLFFSGLSAIITVRAQQSAQAVRTLHQFSLAIRIENAIVAYGQYVWKMLWPARLAPLYPHSESVLPGWQVALSALVLVSITVLVVVLCSKRYLLVGWFWFLGTLIPVIGLVQVGDAAMADRYAYIPLVGIFVMIAWGLADWAEARKVPAVWQVIPAACVLAALGVVTSRQLSYWDSEYDLWSHTLAVTERNPFAHDSLGAALMDPNTAMTPNNLENLNTEQQRMDEARLQYEEALKIRRELAQENPAAYLPDMANTLINLANHDRTQKRIDEAREHYEEALKIHRQLAQQDPDAYVPYLAIALNDLGILDVIQNRTDDARRHYEEALKFYRQLTQLNPDAYLPYLAVTLNDLANLDESQGRTDDARRHYEEALNSYRQLAQRNRDAYLWYVAATLNNLGVLDRNQNRIEESRGHYNEALSLFRRLAEVDPSKYAGDVRGVEARLKELDEKEPSK